MNLVLNLRFAARSLLRSSGLSITVVLLLAFGIGANAALFHLIYSVLLRPIPGVSRSGDLILIRRTDHGRLQGNQSYPDYLDYAARAKTLERIVAERLIPVSQRSPDVFSIPMTIAWRIFVRWW